MGFEIADQIPHETGISGASQRAIKSRPAARWNSVAPRYAVDNSGSSENTVFLYMTRYVGLRVRTHGSTEGQLLGTAFLFPQLDIRA